MDNPNNTSPNPKILTAASWLMIVVGILVMIRGGMNVAYCADADRLRTIAGMMVPAILIIIGGILVERSKRYREASTKAMSAVALAIACEALLKTMDAPDALVANATLYSAWSIIQHLIVILITIVWLGLMLLTIRYETNRQGGVVIDEDDEDDEDDE